MTSHNDTNSGAMTEPYWNPSGRTVSQEEKQAFATRLYDKMVELGWTQADLARNAFGEENGKVIDREKVSLWLRGQGIPGEQKMRKLACALNLTLAELAPKVDKSPLQRAIDSKMSFDSHYSKGDTKYTQGSYQAKHLKLRKPVQLSSFATVQLQPGGKVILQLELSNEVARTVMDFAQKKVEQAAADAA